MFLSINTFVLVSVLAVSWIAQVLLSVKPKDCDVFVWAKAKETLVKQANEIFFLFISLGIAWVGHNVYFIGHQLIILVWLVRIYAAYLSVSQFIIMLLNITEIMTPIGRRLTLSVLFVIASSTLIFLSV